MQHAQWQALIAQLAGLSRHQRLEGMKLLGSTPTGQAASALIERTAQARAMLPCISLTAYAPARAR